MNSQELTKYGFDSWHKFNFELMDTILELIPKKSGAYVIRYKELFGRFKVKSDLLYFGSAINKLGGMRARVKHYFKPGPTQETSKRINKFMQKIKGLEISYVVVEDNKKARQLERDLRNRYEGEHGEFPPWNRKA